MATMLVAITPEQWGQLVGRPFRQPAREHVVDERTGREPSIAEHGVHPVVVEHPGHGLADGVHAVGVPVLGRATTQFGIGILEVCEGIERGRRAHRTTQDHEYVTPVSSSLLSHSCFAVNLSRAAFVRPTRVGCPRCSKKVSGPQ